MSSTNTVTLDLPPLCTDVISLKAANTREPKFIAYQGKIEENGAELYTLTQKTRCKPLCRTWPDTTQVFECDKLVGDIIHIESKMCCRRVTTHEVGMYTPDGRVHVSRIRFELPKCRRDLVVIAEPFFKSPPTRYCFISFLIALIIMAYIMDDFVHLFRISLLLGAIVYSLVIATIITLLIVVILKRGCTYNNSKRRKLLELYNVIDNTPAAIISRYCPTCAIACCKAEYEIELLQPMDLPKTLTLLGITLRLHWAMRFLET